MFLGTFEDKEITHVEGEVDPVRDLDIINEELRLKDEEAFLKNFDDLEKKYQRGEKKLKQEYVSFTRLRYIYIYVHVPLFFFGIRCKSHWWGGEKKKKFVPGLIFLLKKCLIDAGN